MADEVRAIAEALRQSALECHQAYGNLVDDGEVLTYEDGTVANFATVYMASRLIHNDYADVLMSSRSYDERDMGEEVRQVVEQEIISSASLPDGHFGLDLAFLMLQQVDWPAIGDLLRRTVIERREALMRLRDGDNADIPQVESRPMNPEEWQRLTGQK